MFSITTDEPYMYGSTLWVKVPYTGITHAWDFFLTFALFLEKTKTNARFCTPLKGPSMLECGYTACRITIASVTLG